MALRSYVLTLAAGAQRASNAYGGSSLGNVIHPTDDIPYRQILLQATGADAFLGMDAATDSTTYGTKIDSTDLQPVTLRADVPGAPLKLSDLWVAGAGATLHVTGVPF